MKRSLSVDINFDALSANFDFIKSKAPNSKMMSVVKADAYGHGAGQVAACLADKTDAFAVAIVNEAIALREAGVSIPIVVLEGPQSSTDVIDAVLHNLQLFIHARHQIDFLGSLKAKDNLKVWLKVDTGMHRLGFFPDELNELIDALKQLKGVDSELCLATHLASADEPGNKQTQSQIDIFNQICKGYDYEKTAANSAGLLAWPEAHFDWVRPGVALYGGSPFCWQSGLGRELKAVMRVHAPMIAIRQLKKGDAVGYGGTWICPEDMPVGIIAIGYGDGYPRHAPSGTPTLVGNHIAPVVGRVSMDMIAVDLRQANKAKVGALCQLWGDALSVNEVADWAKTIPYELTCQIKYPLS